MLESTFEESKTTEDTHVPNKSLWEVATEYATLTHASDKPIEARVDGLKGYFTFYGYVVEDEESFKGLIRTFLNEAAKTEKIIEGVEEVEKKFRLSRKEQTFKEMQEFYKDPTHANTSSETFRKSYNIFDRPVTLLLSADEKMVEIFETISPSQTLESQLERLVINEFPLPISDSKRRTTKSLYLKRSRPELTRATSRDNFSAGALKVIFSYLDYGLSKYDSPDFIVVGNFVILVTEVLLHTHL